MKNYYYQLFLLLLVMMITSSCRKNKEECVGDKFSIQPFVEKFGSFTCGGNLYEYEYIKRNRLQIDSLEDCTFSPPIAFPVDESDMVYIMVGKEFTHYGDTFQTQLWKDTCDKKLIYEVNKIQRDTTRYCCPYGVTAVTSMFCSVSEIPSDYQVEIKYKYVPLE